MRTNKPVVAPKRLTQNGGEVSDCPHTKRDEILVAQLGDLPYLDLLRDEPRNEVPTPICTMKIFNVAVVVGGDYPELRAPLRSRRASIIYIDEIIMMTEV